MLPLLKFRLRFPKYNLHLVSGPLNVDSELMRIAEILVNNANTTWIRFIKQHIITQVLVKGSGRMQGTDPVRIVIKERHAPDWMRKCMGHARDDVDTYAERLGLGPISSDIGFGVDYS
ncbi:hypothetical protein yc1106_04697 [Curvularia clavata]|uniref:Uncharacterized protein n=1 Tax=Curvularia clavata TaxID=95742 RepID=A0A9Q9DRF4_CURCL|nr:hypothetical protein yc1106_04697 [Curvularia clavata]